MLDYVLLEKRNQYLKKIIQKTHDLTESVKLLSNIDKQLYTHSDRYYQYGGSFNAIVDRFNTAFKTPHTIDEADTIKIRKLTEAITKLETTAQKYTELHTKMDGINPVFIKELNKMGETIDSLINKIDKANTTFDEFELKQAIELFPNIKTQAEAYTAAFENFKTHNNETNKTAMLNAYKKLIEQTQKQEGEPNYNLFDTIVKVLYPPIPWDPEEGEVYNDAPENL